MHGTSIPDNYSNDDKKNEVFALPLVGRRRKAHEANLNKLINLPSKRSNALGPKKNDIGSLEMKRTKSAAHPNERLSQQPP